MENDEEIFKRMDQKSRRKSKMRKAKNRMGIKKKEEKKSKKKKKHKE